MNTGRHRASDNGYCRLIVYRRGLQSGRCGRLCGHKDVLRASRQPFGYVIRMVKTKNSTSHANIGIYRILLLS